MTPTTPTPTPETRAMGPDEAKRLARAFCTLCGWSGRGAWNDACPDCERPGLTVSQWDGVADMQANRLTPGEFVAQLRALGPPADPDADAAFGRAVTAHYAGRRRYKFGEGALVIGDALRLVREKSGHTMGELARFLGVSVSTVSALEMGRVGMAQQILDEHHAEPADIAAPTPKTEAP